MLALIREYTKTFVVIFTLIIAPTFLAGVALLLDLRQTSAQTKTNTVELEVVKKVLYTQDGKFTSVIESLQRIEQNRINDMIKARDERLGRENP